MNVCVIGNSHTAALKKAYDTSQSCLDKVSCYFRFFASTSKNLRALYLDTEARAFVTDDKVLTSMLEVTSGGSSTIDLDDFDCFLLIGMTKSYSLKGHYSEAVLSCALDSWYGETLGVSLGRQIHTFTGKPVFLLHTPFKSNEQSNELAKSVHYLESYFSGTSMANKFFMYDKGLILLRQPTLTINGDGKSTNSTYSVGSTGLIKTANSEVTVHPASDVSHMNELYGELVLREFVSQNLGIKAWE